MHRERQRREGRKTVLFPGCSTLKSIPEMSVELLLYSLNERGVEQTRSQIALFARGASLKAEENAARAPKVRARKMLGLFRNYALKNTQKCSDKGCSTPKSEPGRRGRCPCCKCKYTKHTMGAFSKHVVLFANFFFFLTMFKSILCQI